MIENCISRGYHETHQNYKVITSGMCLYCVACNAQLRPGNQPINKNFVGPGIACRWPVEKGEIMSKPTLSTKPFNLEAAISGAAVRTRGGDAVTGFHCFPNAKDIERVYGVVRGNVKTWYINGKLCSGIDHSEDLFMAPVKREGWANLLATGEITPCIVGIYTDRESADRSAGRGSEQRIACIRIEWEE